MVNGIDFSLIITLWIGVGIPMLGWIYVTHRNKKLALAQRKYDMKVERYSKLSETIEESLTYLSTIKGVQLIDIEKEEDIKANYLKVLGLAGFAGIPVWEGVIETIETFGENLPDQEDDQEIQDDVQIELLREIKEVILEKCWLGFGKSAKNTVLQQERLRMIEPESVVIEKIDAVGEVVAQEIGKGYINMILKIAEMESLMPKEEPQKWVEEATKRFTELKEIMFNDLQQTL